jgi:pimeloyl-ACP methyl ester carboxylesterase
MRVLFLHGLEGSPQGDKPTRLRSIAGVEVIAPALPTGPLQVFRQANPRGSIPAALVQPSLELALATLEECRPEVVVGSSFGGGVALWLAFTGAWQGPLVLLAPAGVKVLAPGGLKARAGRVLVVHGRRDEVVPVDDSLALARDSACELALWLVDDEHRLAASVGSGLLERALSAVR